MPSFLKPSKLKGGSAKARSDPQPYRTRELSTGTYLNAKLKRLELIKPPNAIIKTTKLLIQSMHNKWTLVKKLRNTKRTLIFWTDLTGSRSSNYKANSKMKAAAASKTPEWKWPMSDHSQALAITTRSTKWLRPTRKRNFFRSRKQKKQSWLHDCEHNTSRSARRRSVIA